MRYLQHIGGVEVIGGSVNVLLDGQGGLLSLDSLAIPAVSSARTNPALDREDAALAAERLFFQDTGLPVTRMGDPRLRFERVLVDKVVTARLVWEVEAHFSAPDTATEGYRYRIDARTGALSSRLNAVHHDVSGTLRTMATPGSSPDTPTNPEVSTIMAHATVSSSSGNTTSDINGDFTISGASYPLDVTLTYDGTFVTMNNMGTTDYSQVYTLTSGGMNFITMNGATDPLYTAEANAFVWVNKIRDWTRSVNPGDATCDFNATCNVNRPSTCNAYYDGSSINFYPEGGGCVNTSFSSVVIHEYGHWLNDLYNSGNGWDGFGEGAADTWSIYILDDPVVGRDWQGPGTYVRTALNTRPFCGDGNEGCYGQVHTDGEVLMGALWKVRDRLKTAHGTTAGGAIADNLLNAWMNAYDDTMIQTIIETHWLTLDDDDGDIGNGTPNYPHIDGGFRDQSFPGFDLTFVSITNVSDLPNTPYEAGPYTVTADFSVVLNPPLTAQNLYYRVSGGSFTQVPMTLVAGTTYGADIPGQISPANVEYYVQGIDNLGNYNVYPQGAPTELMGFLVGVEEQYFFDDFESGVGGWTRSGGSNDWEHSSEVGSPNGSYGKASDPTSATSGTHIFGTDLGQGPDDGEYENYVDNSLYSPTIDCTTAVGATLRYQRWLRVEKSRWDQATVLVNGTEIWVNDYSVDHLDSAWVQEEFDISAYADGNPSVQLEWNMDTDSSVTFGGWNVDDVEVLATVATVYADATTRNGSGVNPNIFTSVTNPMLGTIWQSDVDAGSIGSSGPVVMFVFSGSLPGGMTQWGEVLLDPSSAKIVTRVGTPDGGGISHHNVAVPDDTSLHGTQVYAQAFVALSGGGQFTNALDLTLGY